MTITGFIFETNEYGLQTFTYDPDLDALQLPLDFMQAEAIAANELMEGIINDYPQFYSLPENIQNDILVAAIYLNMQSGGAKKPEGYDACVAAAKDDFAISLGVSSVTLNAFLFGCGFTGPAVGLCIASTFATYGISVGTAYWMYRRAVKRCG